MEESTHVPAKIINKDRPVYFSYARNSSRKPEWEHISDCMSPLLEEFKNKNIEYRLDKRDIGMGDKISDFENEIGWKSEVVVIVFSDKYFRSMHCMYEFVQIKRALEKYPKKRLMCIKSGDFDLSDVNYIRDLERYWNNQKFDYEDIEYHRLREHSGTEKAAWQNGFYLDDIRKLYSFFSAINYSYAQRLDCDSFTSDIIKYYANTPKQKLTPKYETKCDIQNPQPTKVNNVQATPPPVTVRQPYYVNMSYSQQQDNNSLLKMVVLAVVILVFLLLFGIFYGFHRLGFGAIFTLILPIETFLWYKICNLWTEQTHSTLLKTIIRISKWFFVIVTACYELFLLFNWARIL